MKKLVNGVEVEVPAPDGSVQVETLADRLMVRGKAGNFTAIVELVAGRIDISVRGNQYRVEKTASRSKRTPAPSSGEIRAPMAGLIVEILVSEGACVQKGEKLVVLEAMKTQQAFTAPFDGTVEQVRVSKNEQVQEGTLLVQVLA